MNNAAVSANGLHDQATLPALTSRSIAMQLMLLLAAAFLLPAAAHATGLPVRMLLPMHWPVIFAGLCYGWRSGALIGLFAPFLSFLISGMPLPHILPSMTVELAAYGFLAGLARETFRLNLFLSAGVALIGGRVIFLAMALATGAISASFGEYLQAAMLPGVWAALAQLVILPLAAKWWVGSGRR